MEVPVERVVEYQEPREGPSKPVGVAYVTDVKETITVCVCVSAYEYVNVFGRPVYVPVERVVEYQEPREGPSKPVGVAYVTDVKETIAVCVCVCMCVCKVQNKPVYACGARG